MCSNRAVPWKGTNLPSGSSSPYPTSWNMVVLVENGTSVLGHGTKASLLRIAEQHDITSLERYNVHIMSLPRPWIAYDQILREKET